MLLTDVSFFFLGECRRYYGDL